MPQSTPGSLTSEQSSTKSDDSKKIMCTEVFDENSNPTEDGKKVFFKEIWCFGHAMIDFRKYDDLR